MVGWRRLAPLVGFDTPVSYAAPSSYYMACMQHSDDIEDLNILKSRLISLVASNSPSQSQRPNPKTLRLRPASGLFSVSWPCCSPIGRAKMSTCRCLELLLTSFTYTEPKLKVETPPVCFLETVCLGHSHKVVLSVIFSEMSGFETLALPF